MVSIPKPEVDGLVFPSMTLVRLTQATSNVFVDVESIFTSLSSMRLTLDAIGRTN